MDTQIDGGVMTCGASLMYRLRQQKEPQPCHHLREMIFQDLYFPYVKRHHSQQHFQELRVAQYQWEPRPTPVSMVI